MEEKPKLHVVSFSGGKDSTAMLLRMIEEGYPIDIILYFDTGLEFPEMDDHIKKVEEYIGREITKIKSEKDFMYWATEYEMIIKTDKIPGHYPGELVKGKGWPTRKARWCNQKFKRDLSTNYLRELKKKYEIVMYIGIAVDEPSRIADENYPLVNWSMTEKDCLRYCYDRGFTWGGSYEIWDRLSCWCCPLQSLDSLRKLKTHRSDLWEQLKEMDLKIQDTTQPNFKFTISLTDIERRFEVEDEFISLGKKLRTKEFFSELKKRGINY